MLDASGIQTSFLSQGKATKAAAVESFRCSCTRIGKYSISSWFLVVFNMRTSIKDNYHTCKRQKRSPCFLPFAGVIKLQVSITTLAYSQPYLNQFFIRSPVPEWYALENFLRKD